MASLFASHAECGPVNDLKQLGSRLNVDSGLRQDRHNVGNTADSSLKSSHQPYRALPQLSSFRVNSAPPVERTHAASYGQGFVNSAPSFVRYDSYEQSWPAEQALNSTREYAREFRARPPALSVNNGMTSRGSSWASEHHDMVSSSPMMQTQSRQLNIQPHQYGGRIPNPPPPIQSFRSYQHQQPYFELTQAFEQVHLPSTQESVYPNYHPQAFPEVHSPLLPAQKPSARNIDLDADQKPHPDDQLKQTAREILALPGVHAELIEGQEQQDNPFASSDFFQLMKDLALDNAQASGSGTQHGTRVSGTDVDLVNETEQERLERNRSNLAELASHLGCSMPIQQAEEERDQLEQEGLSFNLDRAIPSIAQPVFDEQGRWVSHHLAREKQLQVPRNLNEALRRARERELHMDTGTPDLQDDFDQSDFADFYGRDWQQRQYRAQSDTQFIDDLQTALSGVTAKQANQGLSESDYALDDVMAEKQRQTYRMEGYFQKDDAVQGRYLFVSDNPYISDGQESMQSRDSTVMDSYRNLLEHEAKVLDYPSSPQAWYDLAIKQQELERDDQAIRALLQCISLDPKCKPAYLALSVSYTNEGMIREGHGVLESWVDTFQGGGDADLGRARADEGVLKNQRHEVLTRELMRIARQMPEGDIDADVQVALGVLFNASEEYDKAQDCFRAALHARQDDWMLYNRLGATLANGGKSEQALQYYERALDLNPGYVRAMFNVGISLIKLGRYRHAARYILDAIRLQQADAEAHEKQLSTKSISSNALWSTLGAACVHLSRPDLYELCSQRNLTSLDAEFNDYN